MSTQPVLHRILQWVVFGTVTHYDQTGFNLEIHGRFNVPKPANKVKHTDGFNDKNHPIVSIETEKAFDKNPTRLHDKGSRYDRTRGKILLNNKSCI